MVPCAICGSTDFLPVGAVVRPTWRDHRAETLESVADTAHMGECSICGHVAATHALSDETVERVYGFNPAIFPNPLYSSYSPGPSPLYFTNICQPYILDKEGVFIDFGSGAGRSLMALHENFNVPFDRLLGLDYTNRMPKEIPFLRANLDALDVESVRRAMGDRPLRFAMSTSAVEHMINPRGFFKALKSLCDEKTVVYIDVPDTTITSTNVGYIAICIDHVQHFTQRTLTILVESCGFRVISAHRDQGGTPTLRLLLMVAPSSGAATVVRFGLELIERAHQRAIDAALEAHQSGVSVGFWGIGSDFIAIRSRSPEVSSLLENQRIALFDTVHAGKSMSGSIIQKPDAIAAFDGVVFIIPLMSIRWSIKAAMTTMDLPQGRVVDPYETFY